MAFPFGGHPTFAEYLLWAQQQGCSVQSGVHTGQSVNATMIAAKSGRWVVEVGTKQTDRLVPTTIGRLDRRLGLTSPWFALPPQPVAEPAPPTLDEPSK